MGSPEDLREALLTAGAGELAPGPRAWLEHRLTRFGFSEAARNPGGLRCALPHDHTDGACLATLSATGAPPRRLAVFDSIAAGAAALVETARRAGAHPNEPVDDLQGFRSVHAAGPLGPDAAARRFRLLTGDWEAFERAGVRDPQWQAFRDAWRAGRPAVEHLPDQEARANQARARLVSLDGIETGISDDAAARLVALRARVDAHDAAVSEGQKIQEPEVQEYSKRWGAFKTELSAVEADVKSTFVWVQDVKVSVLEAHFNLLRDEWEQVGNRVAVRKGQQRVDVLEELVQDKAAGKKYPIPALPKTTATQAPPPPVSPPLGLPVGLPFNVPLAQLLEDFKTFGIAAAAVAALVAVASIGGSAAAIFGRK